MFVKAIMARVSGFLQRVTDRPAVGTNVLPNAVEKTVRFNDRFEAKKRVNRKAIDDDGFEAVFAAVGSNGAALQKDAHAMKRQRRAADPNQTIDPEELDDDGQLIEDVLDERRGGSGSGSGPPQDPSQTAEVDDEEEELEDEDADPGQTFTGE